MKLATLNINRRYNSKTKEILDILTIYDIVFLQELGKITRNKINKLKDISNGDIIYNDREQIVTNAIYISNKIQILNKLVIEHIPNRIIQITGIIKDKTINLINIYAPVAEKQERQHFYEELQQIIMKTYNYEDIFILAGDFNTIENIIDAQNTQVDMIRYKSGKILTQICKTYKLIDIFRHTYPTKQIYSLINRNNRGGSRIDRIYINKNNVSNVKTIKYKPIEFSDHKLLEIDLTLDNTKWGKGKWKINNSILSDEKYRNKIREYWIKWREHPKRLIDIREWWEIGKEQIKKITINYCTEIKTKRDNTYNELMNKLLKLEQEGTTNTEKYNDIKKVIYEIDRIRDKGIIIRSRMRYEEGDEGNIKIFKDKENSNNNNTHINSVINTNNEIIDDKDKIIEEIGKFYTELYTTQDVDTTHIKQYINNAHLNKLGNEDKNKLHKFITKTECLIAIKEFENNKSPGIDGISKEFYLTFWDILADDITDVINNIYLKGELNNSMKQAIITLHYKGKGDHRLLKNWRPISLLCTDYKIISKVISNRLKTVTHKLISELQTGAGKDKSILDNLINIDSIINYMELKHMGGALISFDQEKAFDRIEHNYLLSILEAYNFPNNIIKWIKILYTNINSSVLINGKISKKFRITRSVRQGCPLSMTLYALAIEPLANYIKLNTNIIGIKIPNCSDMIKIFQHADDCNTIITTETSYEYIIKELISSRKPLVLK